MLKDGGVTKHQVFLSGQQLFVYAECEDAARMRAAQSAAMREGGELREWLARCDWSLMQSVGGPRLWSSGRLLRWFREAFPAFAERYVSQWGRAVTATDPASGVESRRGPDGSMLDAMDEDWMNSAAGIGPPSHRRAVAEGVRQLRQEAEQDCLHPMLHVLDFDQANEQGSFTRDLGTSGELAARAAKGDSLQWSGGNGGAEAFPPSGVHSQDHTAIAREAARQRAAAERAMREREIAEAELAHLDAILGGR